MTPSQLTFSFPYPPNSTQPFLSSLKRPILGFAFLGFILVFTDL